MLATPQMPQSVPLYEAGVANVDVVDHARDLGLAPALLDVQGADDVRPPLAAEGDVPGLLPAVPVIWVPPPEPARRRSDPGSAPRSSR